MASLVGQLLKNIYRGLIITSDNNIITSTPKNLTDGLGNASALSLSTNSIVVSGSLSVTSGITGSLFGSASYALSASYAPGGSSPSYKVYTALLTQIGLTAPTVVVLENTLGFTPTWNYNDVGWYNTNSTSFTEKTTVFLGSPSVDTSTEVVTFASARTPSSGGSVVIQSRVAGTRTNSKFYNTSIEIRVYN